MHVGMILEMAAEGLADRVAVGPLDGGVTFAELGRRARRAGTLFAAAPGTNVVLADENSLAVPLGLFGAAIAGKPFVPVNYRLADDRLRAIVERAAPALVIAGAGVGDRLSGVEGIEIVDRTEFLRSVEDESVAETDGWGCDPEAVAVLLFTSGTTGEPKAAVLRHRNLAAYIVTSLEFGGAGEDEAAVVSVPPYHIAAVSSVLSSTYTGRRVVQLESFEPRAWVRAVREELRHPRDGRAHDARPHPRRGRRGRGGPALDALARLRRWSDAAARGRTGDGGAGRRRPRERLWPDRDVEHDRGARSRRPPHRLRQRRRGGPGPPGIPWAGSCPGSSCPSATPWASRCPMGRSARFWVRGEQVSGEYLGRSGTVEDGWFNTRDAGRVDADGFLYVQGRLDDVIVRGGENLSPGEIEAVLLDHPAVLEAAVVGIPDVEWGERVVAAVVLRPGDEVTEDELRAHVQGVLRSARTPERIRVQDELPFNETGKLLRRVLRDELATEFTA